MTSRRFNKLQEDVEGEDFLVKIDMNLFKSIWGLMLGILLLGVNRPGQARLARAPPRRLRPLLRISLLGVNRPIWAGLTSSVVNYVETQEGR